MELVASLLYGYVNLLQGQSCSDIRMENTSTISIAKTHGSSQCEWAGRDQS